VVSFGHLNASLTNPRPRRFLRSLNRSDPVISRFSTSLSITHIAEEGLAGAVAFQDLNTVIDQKGWAEFPFFGR